MIIQISSGRGPIECEKAVALFAQYLEQHGGIVISRLVGENPSLLRSCLVSIAGGDKFLGTIKWVWKSEFRPATKRKNWFIQVTPFAYATQIDFDVSKVRYEAFHASGPGGQHVNKTQSAVRAIYEPTGDSVVIMDERSQHLNKERALKRLRENYSRLFLDKEREATETNWKKHTRIERGNAIMTFIGPNFKLKERYDK